MAIVRTITDKDIERVLEIYRPYILESAATFEFQPPTLKEFTERIHKTLEAYPWLVFEDEGLIKGYAYAGPHRSRKAYLWSVESSVYIDSKYKRQNVGRALYEELFGVLDKLGLANIYAGITLPNQASISFHESFGFEKIGVYKKVGYKFNKWHDVVWYSYRLSDSESMESPRLFSNFKENIIEG